MKTTTNKKQAVGISVRQFFKKWHTKILRELSKEIPWQSHGESLSLIRQQPSTAQQFITNKNKQVFRYTCTDIFFLSLFCDSHLAVLHT